MAEQWRNTTRDYGLMAKYLHWLTALFFLGSYFTIYYKEWLTEKGMPIRAVMAHTHFSIGVSVAVIVFLRIIWKFTNPKPASILTNPTEQRVVSAGHALLYAVMIFMPVSGYISTKVPVHFFYLFDIPKFADTQLYNAVVTHGLGLTWKAFRAPIHKLHKISGAYIVWVLILGHASAAWYHHFTAEHSVLERMLFKRNNKDS